MFVTVIPVVCLNGLFFVTAVEQSIIGYTADSLAIPLLVATWVVSSFVVVVVVTRISHYLKKNNNAFPS